MKNAYALAVTLAVGLAEKLDGKVHYNSQPRCLPKRGAR